jgi:manganese oxidase
VEFDLAPGATREVSFVAGAAGTYHYYAITDPAATKMTDGPSGRWYEDGALSGAFIVDDQASAAVPDRVWVINIVSLRESPIMQEHEILTINGRAWPHTERISAREGVPVRWRVVNSTPSEHPMHLHGAYFTVLGVGNAERYSARSPAERRTVVTEFMPPEGTYDMEWTPRAAGNWLFHCHYMLHMVADLAVPRIVKAAAHGHATPAVQQSVPAPDAHGMGGLVLAVTVEPRANAAGKAEPPRRRARQLELVLEQGPAAAGAIMTTLRGHNGGEPAE